MFRLKHSIIGVAAFAAFCGAAQADEFFKNKTVTVVVPSGSGGTYHLYCQILSRHLGKYLGDGTAKVVTQNRPGAGGAKAARYMVSAAPKDGSYIAMVNPGSIAVPMLRPDIGFDTREFAWLGSMSGRAYTVGVWHETPVKTVEDATKRETIMGTSGTSSTSYLIPNFMNHALGTKFKIITGYKGGGAMNLAIARGEVEGRGNFYTGYLGVRPEWIEENKITFLARLGPERPDLQHVPRLRDMMKTDLQREMLDALEVSFIVGQAFFAPPGIAKDRLDTLRTAFINAVKDEALRKEAAERHLPVNWLTHEQVLDKIDHVFDNTSDEAVKQLVTVMGFDKTMN